MNEFSSGDKPEDDLQPLFVSDKNGNTYSYHPKPPPPQSCSAGCWHAANPDDMVVDYEANAAADGGENVALNAQCVEELDHQKTPTDFSGPSRAVVTGEPRHPHSSCHSLRSPQGQSEETSPPFAWEPQEGDWSCADCPDALQLNQTFDMRVDNATRAFAEHHAVGKSQSLHASGSLQPTGMRSGNTSLSCSVRPSSHSDKTHVTGTSYDRGVFKSPAATASEAQGTMYTAFSEVLMQTEAFVPDAGNACPYSSGNVTSEYTDGPQQRLVGEKEAHALTPVSDGMDVPSGSAVKEFFCLSNDEPHSASSYGPKEMGQNLGETVSGCLIDDKCPCLVPAFDNSTAPVLCPEPKVAGAEHTQIAPHEEDLEIQNHTIELVPGSPPGHSLELTWDENDMVISANDTICMSTPIPNPLNATFFVSPVEATEKCSNLEKGHRELSKPNLGKPTTKANTPIGSKVRKNKIISYPRPNFKNVKAKVMSRPALQPHDPALPKVTPRPQLASASSSPSSVSSSRQLTVLSKPRRSDLNADTKTETPINKTQKQQLNKLITSQAERVATHSKNASHKVSRTTPALKSNREDVDKASSSNSACEPGSVASFLQKCRGLFSVTMESPECLEMTYVSNIQRISPEEKGERENGDLLEKQDLKKDILNETFEYGSLFLGSASKTATPAGRSTPKPEASSLRIAPGPKAKVGPSASCLRCTSNSRTLSADRTLSYQRIRRAAGSAMIVRFLTKRFIGDYEPNTGKLYSRLVCVEGDQLSLQIQDTPGGIQVQDNLMQVVDSLSKCVQWAEGFLLVYSITDYDSYQSIRPLYQHIRKVHPDSKAPIIIVGNKGDLLHARQVQTDDGVQLANELGSLFLEISTSENYEDVCDVFQHLCKEVSKLHGLSGERRRASIIPRPRSPNMQDLKRRFKQALSPKVKAPSSLG